MKKCPSCDCIDFKFYKEIDSDKKTVLRIYRCTNCNYEEQVLLQKDNGVLGRCLKKSFKKPIDKSK